MSSQRFKSEVDFVLVCDLFEMANLSWRVCQSPRFDSFRMAWNSLMYLSSTDFFRDVEYFIQEVFVSAFVWVFGSPGNIDDDESCHSVV